MQRPAQTADDVMNDLPRVRYNSSIHAFVADSLGKAINTLTVETQVLLENYLMLSAALENQNLGRLQDMLQ